MQMNNLCSYERIWKSNQWRSKVVKFRFMNEQRANVNKCCAIRGQDHIGIF